MSVKGYRILAQDYYWRAERNLERMSRDGDPSWFFYAAFEYRCAVEQTLRMYLEVLQVDWTKSLEKICEGNKIKKAILRHEPEFYGKLKFVDVIVKGLGRSGVYQVDLDKVGTMYGMLGSYMHAQIRPDDTVENPQWWKQLKRLIDEVREYLYEVLRHDVAQVSFQDGGLVIYEEWKAGKLSDHEVLLRFIGADTDP